MSISKLVYPLDSIQPGEKTEFDSVLFVPRIWDSNDGVASNISGIGNATGFTDLAKKTWDSLVSAFDAIADMDTSKESFIDNLSFVKYDNGGGPGPMYISLPFDPRTLTNIRHSLNWSQEDQINADEWKNAAKTIEETFQAGQALAQGNVAGAAAAGKGAISSAGRTITAKAKNMILDGMQKKVKIGNFGLAIYQPKRQMFSGINTMSLSFDWEFVPKNEKEAKIIIEIIDAFRVLSYPVNVGGSGSNVKMAVRQPALWHVIFPSDGKFNNMVVKDNAFFCIIKDVGFEIGRASDSTKLFPHHGDGFPNLIKMTITMEEYFSVIDGADRFGTEVSNKFKSTAE